MGMVSRPHIGGGIRYTGYGYATLLALAGLITGETVSPSLWLSLALGMVGVGIIGFSDFKSLGTLARDVLHWLAASVWLDICRRAAAWDISVWPFITVAASVGAVILLSIAAIRDLPIIPPEPFDPLGYRSLR